MTSHYPVVLEHEANGTVSAFVVGLPGVYASADTEGRAAIEIRKALRAHLVAIEALGITPSAVRTTLRVARIRPGRGGATTVGFVGLGALMGRRRSPRKAAAARENGRKGGRPRTSVSK